MKYKLLFFLAVFSFAIFAHEAGEFNFIRNYAIEIHYDHDIISLSIQRNGTFLTPAMDLEIYRNGFLEYLESDIRAADDGYYYVQYEKSGGYYEIRPIFHVENELISAEFTSGEKQKTEVFLWLLLIPAIGIIVGLVRKSRLVIVGSVIIIILLWGLHAYSQPLTTDTHEHADFAVFLEGEQYNFSQERFMTTNFTLSEFVHLHDMNGNVVHKHVKGITLGHFFGTLGMKFNSTCFVVDNVEYCNDGQRTLKMFVNGQPNYDFENYEFTDIDRILITYGNENQRELTDQISSVSGEACIQSGKCPERGTAPDESCSVGKCE